MHIVQDYVLLINKKLYTIDEVPKLVNLRESV